MLSVFRTAQQSAIQAGSRMALSHRQTDRELKANYDLDQLAEEADGQHQDAKYNRCSGQEAEVPVAHIRQRLLC